MWRHYLAATLRHLGRNRLHAALTTAGLAIGFAAAILIGLYVRDEYRYDHWIPGHGDVYRVALGLELNGTRLPPSAGTAAPMAEWLRADYPEIASVARLRAEQRNLRQGGETGRETVFWGDPAIFDVLPLPVMAGELRDALTSPDAMVVTRRVARRYFHTDDAVGRTLIIDDQAVFRVAAVLEDLPVRTHLATEIFVSARSKLALLPPPGAPLRLDVAFDELASALTYLRLRPGSDRERLRSTLQRQMESHVPIPRGPDGRPLVPAPILYLQPLDSIHFVPEGAHAMKPASDPRALRWIVAVGVLILLVAALNFVNLMATLGALRAPEIGVRKLAGARRRHVAVLCLCEAALIVAASLLLAAALVEWLLPWSNGLLGRDMAFDWWRDAQLAGALAGVAVAMVLAGGAWPALTLFRIVPADAMRGTRGRSTGRTWLREVLVTLQFASLVGLLVVTAAIYLQNRFAAGGGLGFDTRGMLVIEHDCRDSLTEAVRAINGVSSAACSDARFGIDGGWVSVSTPPDGSVPVAVTHVAVEAGLLESLGLRPLAGRFFERARPADVTALVDGDVRTASGGVAVINQAAVRWLGYASAEAAIGQPAAFGQNPAPPVIIGVVADLRLFGTRRVATPVVFRMTPQAYRYLMVRLDAGREAATAVAIRAEWQRLEGTRPFKGQFLDGAIRIANLDVLRHAQLFALFSTVTVVIACLGLFGLSVHAVTRRRREIGIRKALGAGTVEVLRLLLWQFGRPVILANLVAWPAAAWALQRWLAGFAYHIDMPWWLFAAAALAALAIALATVCVHCLRSARASPIAALRYE